MNQVEIIAAMRSLPRELEALLAEVSGDQLRRRPAPGEWSILEVCCHLRDAARIEHERIILMASEDDPAIAPWDEQALARERRYNEDSIVAVRRDLDAAWGSLKALFEDLPDDAWQRTGRHPERGAVTIAGRAQRQAEHPREHFQQIREALRP
jgi:uncharacterized damage-inducible protein DinB